MTPTTDATITALRATHDELARVVAGLTDEQLAARSGAFEWTVAHVLSHLGSGAEIALATLRTALDGGGGGGLGEGFNQVVWDRWNAMAPGEQADTFLGSDAELVAAFESLTPAQRADLHVELGFLPAPLPLVGYAGMRLSEAAQHSWDARVGSDETAVIDEGTARLVLDHLASDLGFMFGFTARPGELGEPAVVALDDLDLALALTDTAALVPADGRPTTATFVGPADAVARLVSGRLAPSRTPSGVTVSGNVDLDDLRRVFPGY